MPADRDEVEEAIDEFLGNQPSAERLAELRRTLEQRIEGMRAALGRSTDPVEQARLRKDLATTQRHVDALAREEMITEFVEDSVRATASWSRLKPEEPEE